MEKREVELKAKIQRCNEIIDGLNGCAAFKMLVDDIKEWTDRLDKTWQWIEDEKKMLEARISKMAAITVIDAVSTYERDRDTALEELSKIQDTDIKVAADYDNE